MSVRRRAAVPVMAVVVAALAVVAAGCGDSGSSSDDGSTDTYKIGVATAQTGFMAPFDQPFLEGLKFETDQINAEGGLDGKYQVELDIKDGHTDTGQTVTAAQELIDNGAQFLIVPCDGDLAVAAGQAGQQAGIPTMSSCASPPGMPDKVGDFFFGNSYGDNQDGTVLADFALEEGMKTAFILQSNDTTYTQDTPDYFADVFEAGGGEILGRAQYDLGQTDFSVVVTQIKNLDPQPDVIMTAAYEPDFPAFVKQLRAAGVDAPVWGADAVDTPGVHALGDQVEGSVIVAGAFDSPDTPYGQWVKDFTAETGSPPEASYAAFGADAIRVIDAAVTEAGSTDPEAVRDALASLQEVEGITGPITYDYPGANGMPLKTLYLLRIENGENVLVSSGVPDPETVPPPK